MASVVVEGKQQATKKSFFQLCVVSLSLLFPLPQFYLCLFLLLCLNPSSVYLPLPFIFFSLWGWKFESEFNTCLLLLSLLTSCFKSNHLTSAEHFQIDSVIIRHHGSSPEVWAQVAQLFPLNQLQFCLKYWQIFKWIFLNFICVIYLSIFKYLIQLFWKHTSLGVVLTGQDSFLSPALQLYFSVSDRNHRNRQILAWLHCFCVYIVFYYRNNSHSIG